MQKKPQRPPFRGPRKPPAPRPGRLDPEKVIFGVHAVRAALANPDRRCRKLHATAGMVAELSPPAGLKVELAERAELDRLLPGGTVHQCAILEVEPLEEMDLTDLLIRLSDAPRAAVAVLDRVTDPHNVGAVLRSAAAFGVAGIISQKRHAPPLTGTLAKTASGAAEHVPLVRAINLARALEELQAAGFTCVGLSEHSDTSIGEADLPARLALVLGSEGEGLRPSVAEACKQVVRLPTRGPIESLNVSNAAAIAFHEFARRHG